MTRTILFCLSLVLYVSLVQANEDPSLANRFMAYRMAMAINQIKVAEDLPLYLSLSEADSASYTAEVKAGHMTGFKPLQVTMPSDTKLTVASLSESVTFDYREYSNGILYIGEEKVKLDRKMNLAAFRSVVDKALQPKRSAHWLIELSIPKSNAGAYDCAASVASTVGATANSLYWATYKAAGSPFTSIEDLLIQGYEDDADLSKRVNDRHPQSPKTFMTTRFRCDDDERLNFVQYSAVVRDGQWQAPDTNPNDETLRVKLDGYQYSSGIYCASAKTDENGIVQSTSGKCDFGVHSDLFSKRPTIANFAKLAKKCCAKYLCDKHVNDALTRISNRFQTVKSPEASVLTFQ